MDVDLLPMTGTETSSERPGILIVNDERNFLDLFQVYWEDRGYHPDCFDVPQAALEAYRLLHHSLVLADYRMDGDMDGIRFIKEAEQFSDGHTRFILLSGLDEFSLEGVARKNGIKYFMTKDGNFKKMVDDAIDLLPKKYA